MGARILSAVVLAPVVLACVWFGYPYFELLLALAAALMAWEWRAMCAPGAGVGRVGWALLATPLAAIFAADLGGIQPALQVLAVGVFAVLALGARDGHRAAVWMGAGACYVTLPLLALIWLRADWTAGREVVLWLFLVVWATDTGAFGVGRAIGGPRLAPFISPNKTWAGLFGGMAAAAAVGGLLLLGLESPGPTAGALLGAGAAVVAQGGDLMESWVKRHFSVKDSGRTIPGHGGVLDRVDGILMLAPVLALAGLINNGGLMSWR